VMENLVQKKMIQNQQTREEKQKKQMVNGVLWLSASNIISRLLGAIYIIPWYAWMGEQKEVANGLFGKGYEVYALFLLISTSGIPAAVAKETAYYNSLGEFAASRQYFRSALKTMATLGVVAALIMLCAAPFFANLAGGDAGLVPVMVSLSLAILVFPVMSVIRGFYQGNNNLKPYALSQIFEQVARIFWMLSSTYLIMKVRHGDYVIAVMQSTFAAFIGILASFAVLLWFSKAQREQIRSVELKFGVNNLKLTGKSLTTAVIREAIPFVISGSSIQIFRLIDLWTFNRALGAVTDVSNEKLTALYSLFSANPGKLVMIIIAFSISISFTGLPLITENHALGKVEELAKLIGHNIQLFLFVMLPATFGMLLLAHPLNTCFYSGNSPLGVAMLFWSSLQALILAAVMLNIGIMQGMNLNQVAIKYTLIGSVVKLALQFPMILLFKVYGPLISTTIGMVVIFHLSFKKIREETQIDMRKIGKRSLLFLILSLVMSTAVFVVRTILYLFLSPDQKLSSFIITIVSIIFGVLIYLLLTMKSGIAERILGRRINKIKKFLPFL